MMLPKGQTRTPGRAGTGMSALRSVSTRSLDGALVIAVAVGYVVPMLAQSFASAKEFHPVTDVAPPNGAFVDVVTTLSNVIVLVACLAVVASRWRSARLVAGPVVLLLAAWALGVVGLLTSGAQLTRSIILFPLVAVAVVIVQPGRGAVVALGWVTSGLAALSLAMGVFASHAGRYARPDSLMVDKPVWEFGILAGPYPSGNNLGLALALGLPAVWYLPRRWQRWGGTVVTGAALAWTASRTSWGAAVAAAGIGGVLTLVTQPVWRRRVAVVGMMGAGLVVVALPLIVRSPTAFSNRVGYWIDGLDVWRERLWFGWGPEYYLQIAHTSHDLGGFAYHAHNQAVQLLVTGGVVLFCVVVAAIVWAGVRAARSAAAGFAWPATLVVALLASATFEVPLGFVDREMFYPFVLVPLCTILGTGRLDRIVERDIDRAQ